MAWKKGLLGIVMAGMIGFPVVKQAYISWNLEEGAMKAKTIANSTYVSGATLPMIKNVDLDGNGKYESIDLYKENGIIYYQEKYKDESGKYVLGEKKMWK
jgi:hypothetical protein